jgi:hypothetical protein
MSGDLLMWVIGVIVATAVIMTIYLLVQTRAVNVIEVPQEERVVLYRFGEFSRLAGPGIVTLAGYEREKQRINVRSEYGEYRTNGYYFINGVPFNYSISFWRRYDLHAAASGDTARLAELVQYTDDERRQHLVTKLHEAMYACVQVIQKKYPVPDKESDKATIAAKLLPILPGMPGCDELLALVKTELLCTLPTVGVIMDTLHPLAITNVHVTPEVIDSFGRGRSLAMLREQLPDVSSDLLLQAFTAIQGLDMHTVRLYMDGGTVREVKMGGENIEGYKVRTDVAEQTARREVASSPLRTPPPVTIDEEERLSKADLSVLKRLPPAGAQRAAL